MLGIHSHSVHYSIHFHFLGPLTFSEKENRAERGGGLGLGEGNAHCVSPPPPPPPQKKNFQTRKSGRKTKYNCKASFKSLFNSDEKIGMGEVRKAAVWSTHKNRHCESREEHSSKCKLYNALFTPCHVIATFPFLSAGSWIQCSSVEQGRKLHRFCGIRHACFINR